MRGDDGMEMKRIAAVGLCVWVWTLTAVTGFAEAGLLPGTGPAGLGQVGEASEGPAERADGRVILAQADVSEDERFLLERVDGTRNSLIYARQRDGAWTEIWENPDIVPDQAFAWVNMQGYPEEEGDVYEHPRFSTHLGATFWMYAGGEGEEHERFGMMLERVGDEWKVNLYNDHVENRYAYLFDDKILLNAADFSAMQTAGILFTSLERSAQRFDPAQIGAAQKRLKGDVQGAVRVEYFAEAEPLYMALGRDVRCPVHVAPDAGSPQAAKGKAAVSLKDWVIVLCKEGDWLMILYETGKGKYRTGWIDASQDEMLMEVAGVTMPAGFQSRPVEVQAETQLYDDPVHDSGVVCSVPSGSRVTILWEGSIEGYSEDVAYAEARLHGEAWRGFMKWDGRAQAVQ